MQRSNCFGAGKHVIGGPVVPKDKCYLRFMPVDILKLDRSFVASLHEDNGIAAAIAQLATTLGIQAVAEGTEGPEQWDRLVAMGWTSGQGFLIARPLPADEAVAHLSSGPRLEAHRITPAV